MGRYSEPLAPLFLAASGVEPGQRVLDVGCGPGALTARLVERLGPGCVAAVDPVPAFVEAARARCPGAVVRLGDAQRLPFDDASYDVVLAQLVVQFLPDPVEGLREMARVAGPGGEVAACVWDHAGEGGPLSPFWGAVRALEPDVLGEAALPGTGEHDLARLAKEAGLTVTGAERLTVRVCHETFDDWWEPYTLGVGPAGAHVASCRGDSAERLREECRRRLPEAPFEVQASAWSVRARA
nr:methyltransferase domain-containing protein [Nocardioides sp. zg-DK7169]